MDNAIDAPQSAAAEDPAPKPAPESNSDSSPLIFDPNLPKPDLPRTTDPERPFRSHKIDPIDRDVDLPEKPGPPLNDPENPHGHTPE